MKSWNDFVEKHPKAAQWIREGGLFLIASNLITVLKYLILQFLPYLFQNLWNVDFGWPGIQGQLFGIPFTWNVFGYAVKLAEDGSVVAGGMGYFAAYMIAMVIGEIINFPIQKIIVFRNREKGAALARQIFWYIAAFCIITVIVNSINCIWVDVAGHFVPSWLYNIATIVLSGSISMVIFFFVNKTIFPEKQQ